MTELNKPIKDDVEYYNCVVNSFNNIICNKINNDKYTFINGARLITVKKIIPEYFLKYYMSPNNVIIK